MDNDKDLLMIAVFTFLTVSAWILFELVKTTKTTTVTVSAKRVIVPLSPTIDTDTMANIQNRVVY